MAAFSVISLRVNVMALIKYGGGRRHYRCCVLQVCTRAQCIVSSSSADPVSYVEDLKVILEMELAREHLFLICRYHHRNSASFTY